MEASLPLAISPTIPSAVALIAGAIALLVARRKIQGTTLTATWWWCLIALLANGAVELLNGFDLDGSDATGAALRYAVRALLVCPLISLLGAKRPQHGPWNFIVASLWAVLALPAAESLFLNTGQPLEIQAFRSWFLLVLIVLTLVNTLPTRHWIVSLLALAGQTLLLNDYLPFRLSDVFWSATLGAATLALAAIVYAFQPIRAKAATTLDQLWLDFRDAFGLFWALRVQERLLAAGKMYQWPVVLRWTGWFTVDGHPLREELPEEQRRTILVAFRGLLRRFVSNEWIDRRRRPANEG